MYTSLFLRTYFPDIYLNTILPQKNLSLGLPCSFCPWGFPINILYIFLMSRGNPVKYGNSKRFCRHQKFNRRFQYIVKTWYGLNNPSEICQVSHTYEGLQALSYRTVSNLKRSVYLLQLQKLCIFPTQCIYACLIIPRVNIYYFFTQLVYKMEVRFVSFQ